MRIGILEADKLDEHTQDMFGSYADMFQRLFASINKTIIFERYQITNNEFPDKYGECDAYLITGSKHSAYDNIDWINNLKTLIRELNTSRHSLVGICFGHQIIAEALGGKVLKSDKGWGLGTMTYPVLEQQDWMQPQVEQFKLIISHQDQVQQLPPHAHLIAGNDFCPIAACQIDSHILTFQGHPEFTPDFASHLLEILEPPVPPETVQLAREHLNDKTDHLLVAQWILDFIFQHTQAIPRDEQYFL